jgi:hypothetical protein
MFWFDYFVGKNKSILLTSIHGARTAREEGVKQDAKKDIKRFLLVYL